MQDLRLLPDGTQDGGTGRGSSRHVLSDQWPRYVSGIRVRALKQRLTSSSQAGAAVLPALQRTKGVLGGAGELGMLPVTTWQSRAETQA